MRVVSVFRALAFTAWLGGIVFLSGFPPPARGQGGGGGEIPPPQKSLGKVVVPGVKGTQRTGPNPPGTGTVPPPPG